MIYTTNAIESLHSQLRKIIKTRGHFPNDDAATKLIWLALRNITADWSRAAKEWKLAMNQFAIPYGERFTRHALGHDRERKSRRPVERCAHGSTSTPLAVWQGADSLTPTCKRDPVALDQRLHAEALPRLLVAHDQNEAVHVTRARGRARSWGAS